MKRQTQRLGEKEFDVLVVGGGIYGSAIAWDAALRGLSVALIDKGDFGGATTANSLKTVHGGLRYLQQLDVKRMRESIRERRILLGIAPHLVHPLGCVMPTYGHLMKGKEVMFCGLLLNDIISYDRNRLGDPEKTIPRGRVISKKACLKLVPGMSGEGVTGGAFWTDAQMYSSERMCLAFVLSAAAEGAAASNYVQAVDVLRKGDGIQGVRARDLLTDETFEIRARTVVNASGGWVDRMLGFGSPRIRLSTAMNLVVNRRLLPECAAGIYAPFENRLPDGSTYRGRHVLFMAPWKEATIVGTFHRPYDDDPDALHVSEREVEACLREVNAAYPGSPVRREDVAYFHKGFLPMDGIHSKTGEVVLTKHYRLIDHAVEDGLEGLVSVIGVKYTTARDVAEKVVHTVLRKMGRPVSPSPSSTMTLAGGKITQFDDFLSKAVSWDEDRVDSDTMRHLVYHYGSDYKRILDYGKERPDALEKVRGSKDVIRAEVVHAVREEMAVRLTDVVLRRTDLGSAGYPGDEAVKACSDIMARELGWDRERVAGEAETLKNVYRTSEK